MSWLRDKKCVRYPKIIIIRIATCLEWLSKPKLKLTFITVDYCDKFAIRLGYRLVIQLSDFMRMV